MPTPLSLYFHFPFCETKCHYCDFYSLGREKTKETDAAIFEKAMIQEIKLRAETGAFQNQKIKTIFLGGGTPSMTPPESMERIFNELFKHTSLAPEYEWTMEANPSSIALEPFKLYRKLGINRVSMGVQSLKNEQLIKLGRVHNETEALAALDTVFKSGFENVSTDLLCGVPAQTIEDLETHITKLSAYPIQHLSIYLLTLTKTHRMFKDLPNEETQLSHLLFIDQAMTSRGFEHYEISNFARPGRQAQHNLVYWKGGAYLSFGPSAHSYSQPEQKRFKNISSLHTWADTLLKKQALPIDWTESLSPEQLDLEKWLLALRLDEGFPTHWLTTDRQKQRATLLKKAELLIEHPQKPHYLRATPKGFALNDTLIKELC